jgi:hypothetical protein
VLKFKRKFRRLKVNSTLTFTLEHRELLKHETQSIIVFNVWYSDIKKVLIAFTYLDTPEDVRIETKQMEFYGYSTTN